MLRVFICEDEPNFLASVKRCVENYVVIESLPMPVVCAATSPYEVLDYLESNEKATGLYFLDYHLNSNINGVQLAEQIRTYDPWGAIVFITCDGDSHATTFEYQVEAMDYIVKGDKNTEARIQKCIKNAYTKFISNDAALLDKFVIKLARDASTNDSHKLSKGSTVSIDSRKIVFIETDREIKHHLVVHTLDKDLQFRGTLSTIEKALDKRRFYRLQRNIIVNLENIFSVDVVKLMVVFANNRVIEITPSQVPNLSKRIHDISAYDNERQPLWSMNYLRRLWNGIK